jgi:glycosyl transferase family 25
MKHIWFILFTLSILFIALVSQVCHIESFDIRDSIDFYVISMQNKDTRVDNIAKQQQKMPDTPIKIMNAVNGNEMTEEEFRKLYENGIISKDVYDNAVNNKMGKGVVGCYLSHRKIYEMKHSANTKYTVIFEDDFEIRDDFKSELLRILENIDNKSIDFDYLHLTNLNENHGQHIVDNIYYMDNSTNLYGTQGYLINNANMDRILEYTKFMDRPIDNQIQDQGKLGNLRVLVVWPIIVWHNAEDGSTLEGML